MLRKIFLKFTILAGLCMTPMYGYDCGNCCFDCCDVLETGFLAGAYGSFHTFYMRVKDTLNNDGDQYFYEYDHIQRAPGGGGYLGYGYSFCDRYVMAFKAGVTGFAGEARHYLHEGDINFNLSTENRVKYVVDLYVQPGALIGNCLLMYVNFGASYVDVRQKALTVDETDPFEVSDKHRTSQHEWGYVFGYGARVSLTKCISAYAESQWHSYPYNKKIGRVSTNDVTQFLTNSRVNRLWGFGFNAGLSVQF